MSHIHRMRSVFLPLVGLLAAALLAPSPAAANFETVKTFLEPEGQNISFRAGLSINAGGEGGVPAGTFYVGGRSGVQGVSRYSAQGAFVSHWDAFPSEGLAVLQSTGSIYALAGVPAGSEGVVKIFNANGSKELTSFGKMGASGETVAKGPANLHHVTLRSAGIAVDSAGNVYLADEAVDVKESRIMVFKPETPGDFEHYVYAGQSADIAVGLVANHPVFDTADNLYVLGADNSVLEFAPGQPNTPICTFKAATGGIVGMTVNPDSGEVFYFSAKDRKIHQLAACKEGKFEEIQGAAFVPVPKPAENIEVLAFNPKLQWSESRPDGVLYGLTRNEVKGAPNYIFAPAEVHLAEVDSEAVSAVTSSSALLEAQINPKGATTHYTFQYTTAADFEVNEFTGATEAPLGGALLGGGQEALAASIGISGLDPDTDYRYRVIATTSEGPTFGAAASFHTFPLEAPGLPDERAYELVTPAQKHGGQVFPLNPFIASCEAECKPGTLAPERFPRQSSPNGEAVVYEGFPFSATEGAPLIDEYRSHRTESGWVTENPTPALYQANFEAGYKAFDTDLTTGLFYQNRPPTLAPGAPSEYANLYTQPSESPAALSPLLTSTPPNRLATGSGSFHTLYASASTDLSRIFFAANDALTGSTAFAPASLDGGAKKDNLYESSAGELSLVNVLPGNAATEPGAVFGSGSLLSKETGAAFEVADDFSHAVSDDGSRVFWSSETGQVYVRENAQTTQKVPETGKFLTASADGSALLLGNGHLYDVEELAAPPIELAQGKGGFKGIVGQADDLSAIYFIDTAVLAPGAKEGANNLYSWQEGTTAFIAPLAPQDKEDWTTAPTTRTAEASPNGNWVSFVSREELTGYDNSGSSCVRNSTLEFVSGPCAEAFLYDSGSGDLICASCNPTNATPLGWSHLPMMENGHGSPPQPRYLTNQGRLYFDSRDSLSPFDTNGGIEDVYQYEPAGLGSCKREGGCVSLISAGNGLVDSNFLAIDETGKNVFFTTRDQLLPSDRDELIDLYDARVKGGFPPPVTPPICGGESCLGPPAPSAEAPPSGSTGFHGSGNVHEKKPVKKKHKKKHHKKKKAKHRLRAHHRGGAK